MKNFAIGIDPGPRQSGRVLVDLSERKVVWAATEKNDDALGWLTTQLHFADDSVGLSVIVEWPVNYGLAVGQDVFRTCWLCGCISQICGCARREYIEISRPEVCRILVGNTRGISKGTVNRAVKDLYAVDATGGGADPAIGTSKQPGPLYPMRGSEHAWDALAAVEAWRRK